MDLFASIFKFLADFKDWLLPFHIQRPWEGGVILRLGKFSRRTRPGLNWLWPLGIEIVVDTNISPTTTGLQPQVHNTKDGLPIIASITILWRVRDVERFLLKIEEADDIIVDAAGSSLSAMIKSMTWEELRTSPLNKLLLSHLRRRAFRWGVKIMSVYVMNLSRTGLHHGAVWIKTNTT